MCRSEFERLATTTFQNLTLSSKYYGRRGWIASLLATVIDRDGRHLGCPWLLAPADDLTSLTLQQCLSYVMRREGIKCQASTLTTTLGWIRQAYLSVLPYDQVLAYLSLILAYGTTDYLVYFAVAVHRNSNDKEADFDLANQLGYIQALSCKYGTEVLPHLNRMWIPPNE